MNTLHPPDPLEQSLRNVSAILVGIEATLAPLFTVLQHIQDGQELSAEVIQSGQGMVRSLRLAMLDLYRVLVYIGEGDTRAPTMMKKFMEDKQALVDLFYPDDRAQ